MRSFLNQKKPLLVSMVQAASPDRTKELMRLSEKDGAEAFGMQFCKFKPEYRSKEIYRDLFGYAGDKPVYVTNYRGAYNKDKGDEVLADELLELAGCGATLCDVMGDYFDITEGELTMDPVAIEKQIALIDGIHAKGAEVLMSSHVKKFIPAERVLEIALEHQRRGADISKIVTGAENMAEQIENLRIIDMIKQRLDIPFLFLAGGVSHIMRRIGGAIGSCMYLCVHEHDELATSAQPLLSDVKQIRYFLEEKK